MFEQDIELRSDEVNEVLESTPNWMIRWGISLVFITLVGILGMAKFIRYPDIIPAQITITTTKPPVDILSHSNGKLIKILVADNQIVSKNQILAIIENTANFSDIIYVESLIFKIQNIIDSDSLIEVTFNQNLILGDLLNSYEQLVKNYNEFNLHIELNPQENEISILKKQILEYETLLSKQQIQEQIYAEELELIKKDFERNNQLYNNNVITAREQEDKNRSFLQAKRIHEDIKISISNTKITINNIKKSIQNLHSENRINNSQGKQAIREAMVNLKSGISIWKQNYLIQAPVSGKISFFNFWSINQNVNLGDIVFTIVPSNSFQIIGKMIMPLHNSGKVNLGQKVYVQLNEFPYAEYGMLEGTIENLSLVARKDNYALEVTFHNGLNTNFHKTLPLRQEMKGSAKIITKDLSLLDRVFFQFRNAIIK